MVSLKDASDSIVDKILKPFVKDIVNKKTFEELEESSKEMM